MSGEDNTTPEEGQGGATTRDHRPLKGGRDGVTIDSIQSRHYQEIGWVKENLKATGRKATVGLYSSSSPSLSSGKLSQSSNHLLPGAFSGHIRRKTGKTFEFLCQFLG